MCGFLGVWQKREDVLPPDMEMLTDIFSYRGPDEEGHFSAGSFAVGFRRLQIIDLTTGSQPMFNEDKSICIVLNGEIYNYLELREELVKKGHRFKSSSDTEVLLRLYEEEGEGCVRRLRGMFAFCIYDIKNELLFGARDRFGIKPLFYTENSDIFALASEAKALLQLPGYENKVNESAIPNYLSFQFVPEPETMFQNIFKIPPAHSFTYSKGKLSFDRYWKIRFSPGAGSYEDYLEETRHIMRESVKLHTRSDVPLGAFLSGGIDSSIIVALLRELGSLSTFSVGYEDLRYSELSDAAETARFLETDHEEYLISPREYWDHLPKLVRHLDEPVADPSALSLYFVARMARKKITVTLSGEGADEVFGGYGIYHEPISLKPLTWLPRPALSMMGKGAALLPRRVPGKNYLRRAATPLRERFIGNARIFSEEEKRLLLKKDVFLPATAVTDFLYDEAEKEGYDDVTSMQYIDLQTWMTGDIMVKADKMTMANSLELRVPFLDHHVFEFAATLPTKYKIRKGLTKYLLRQAFSDILPASAVNRPKRGFPVPTRVWLKGPLKNEVEEVLQDPVLDRYFSRQMINRMIYEHSAGLADNSRKLWVLIIFSVWHNQFIKS